MNGSVFEDWLERTFISNLAKERKVVIVIDNAKCHGRFIKRHQPWTWRIMKWLLLWQKHDIEMPNPIPTKLKLLRKIYKKILKTVCHWFYVWKSWPFCSIVAHASLNIESIKNGAEWIKISHAPLESLYKFAIENSGLIYLKYTKKIHPLKIG